MKCGKACLLIGVLTLMLVSGVIYSSQKLFNPINNNPIIIVADTSPDTPAFPPIPNPPGNLDKLLIVNSQAAGDCDKQVTLSEKQLLALPQKTFRTSHTWTGTTDEFSGPLLKDVLNLVCPKAKQLYIRSMDSYSVMVDFPKVEKYQPILALRMNAKPLEIRDKGPLWVMVDSDHFNIPAHSLDQMLVWQLYYITVLSVNN